MTETLSASRLANWIHENRRRLKWTQADLADKLGVTVVTISKLENGHAETTLKTLRKLCSLFDRAYVVTADE